MGSTGTQGELWSAGARDWSELQEPMHRPLFEAMLDAGGVGRGTRVLDVGCGSGGASVLAAQRGASVRGLDLAEGLLEVARQRVPEGEFRAGDMTELPFADGSVDVVIAANAIQFAEDPIRTLHEMQRVCTQDGRIVLGLFAALEKVEFRTVFLAMKQLLPEPQARMRVAELSAPGALSGLLEQAGLRVAATGEVACPFVYPDFEVFRRAILSSGPGQAAVRQLPQERILEVLRAAAEPFEKADGSIVFNNQFQYSAARR